MNLLQDQGLLIAVLDQLVDVGDMARCSVVSKSWHEASRQARPAHLCVLQHAASEPHLTPDEHTFPSAGLSAAAAGMQQWLLHKHRQGGFQKVQRLSVSMKSFLHQQLCQASIQRFWQELLQNADSWALESCQLENAQDSLEKTIRLVPTSVQHLTLCIGQLTNTISLSLLDRFPRLKSVELRSYNPHFRSTFILHQPLFNMRRSDLLFHAPFTVTRNCNLTSCQRQYTQVAPHIYTFADQSTQNRDLEKLLI